MTFGAYLRKKRIEAGLSLRDVSRYVGVSAVFLGEVERGVRVSIKQSRWQALEEAIPGFSGEEVQRLLAETRPMQLSLQGAPPQYQNLGLALARRLEQQDLKKAELDELMRILCGNGGESDS